MIIFTANERSTIKAEIFFKDEEGVARELNECVSVRWQLMDVSRNIINNRSFESGLITVNPVILTNDDLVIGVQGGKRFFGVKIVYNSTNGLGLTGTEEAIFEINNLVNIDNE